MKSLIAFFARQGIFAELTTVGVVLFGIWVMFTIQKEAFPNISYDFIMVQTPFPGASAEETERLITNPLEQNLTEVDGIKRMESVSAENMSVIFMQVDPDQTTEAEAKLDVQEVVDRFVDAPEGAEDTLVTSLESKMQPIITVAISGNISELELREHAKTLERYIESIKEVARVEFSGLRDLEIHVNANPQKLSQYQLTLSDIVAALGRQNLSIPGGAVENFLTGDKNSEIIIRTVGEFQKPEEISETVVRANDIGESIKVKDVAEVKMVLEKPDILHHTNRTPSISLTVLKKEKADALDLVDKIKVMLDEKRGEFPAEVKLDTLNDQSYYIRRRLKVLTTNLGIGLVLVLIILSLVLPLRVAMVTSLGIPFSFLGTMIVFHLFGISLNLISMMGLIIVVGMLVDDAVVVTENSVRLMDETPNPTEAAILGTHQVWKPVVGSVLTTILAFFPLMLVSGIFGKFISFIPLGVIIALAISLYECFFVLPHHIGAFVKATRNTATNSMGVLGKAWDSFLLPSYLKTLKLVLHFRYLVALTSFLLFVGSLILAKQGMQLILFPGDGIETFNINMKVPIGASLKRTEELVKPIEAEVAKLDKSLMDDFSTNIGTQVRSQNDPMSMKGTEYAQIQVFLTPANSRDTTASEIMANLKKVIGTPEGFKEINFEKGQAGPPVGAPINIGVRGQNYEEIMKVVSELKAKISEIEGASDIQDNYSLGKRELRIFVNQEEAAAANLSLADIGRTVRAAFSGLKATTIKKLDEEIDVLVGYNKESRLQSDSLETLMVPNRLGALIPLKSVATIKHDQGISFYSHEDNQRMVRVTGQIDESVTNARATAEKIDQEILPEFRKKYPHISYVFGGEDRDTKESMESLAKAFLVALIGIAFVLIIIFQNLLQPFLIVLTIPLGIMSVIWTFFIHGMPISFMAMLGVIALGGVIVNNSIVLVSFVNENRARGKKRTESIMLAGEHRLRPIVLTTLTTAAGLLPTAYGWGGLDQFVVPVALALGWGVLFGSVLTTVVFPAYLAIMDDLQFQIFKIRARATAKNSSSTI
ncbi:MAG: efflux RND transporter permease subunit [Bdellovibrionales bacterium]|nr:efflux RND transporter permease subunit [Bdellovibrionales bacterium]